MHGLNWLLSNAQIELIAMDVSVTNYKKSRKKAKGGKGKQTEAPAPSASKLESAAQRWKEKYSNKDNDPIPIKGIFDL